MSAPVRLLRVKHPLEGHLEASLSRLAPELAYVELSSSAGGLDFELGERLIVEWSDEAQRARAVVKAREAGGEGALRLTLSMTLTEPDARHYPRLVGGISIRCARRDQALSDVEAWLEGSSDALSELRLSEALDELMNFSVYGLAFESSLALHVGDELLCELGLSRERDRWRTRAQVARAWEIGEGRYGVAIQFTDPPSGLIDTLARFTLELQKLST